MNDMRIDNKINPKSLTQATTFLHFLEVVDSQGGGLLFYYGYYKTKISLEFSSDSISRRNVSSQKL